MTAVGEAPAPVLRPPPTRLVTRLGLRPASSINDRFFGWLLPLVLALFALAQRMTHIASPRCLMFDETYYPIDGMSLWRHGVEGHYSATVSNCEGLASTNSSYGYPAHPPLGKYVIGLGEQIFGFTPLGWRFSDAVLGALSVLLVARIGRRLTGSTLFGCLAGLLMSLDGMELVLSRAGLLDIGLQFWLLCAVACLLADRAAGRTRMALAGPAAWPGPKTGVRWWRVGAGACFGAMCATKWAGLPFLAIGALLSLCWDVGARRTAGTRAPVRAALWREGVQAVLAFVLLPIMIYTGSFAGYFATGSGWDRTWHQAQNAQDPPGVAALRAWWHYHHDVLCFHENLQNDPHKDTCTGSPDNAAHHPSESKPFGWLLLARPVLFAYDTIQNDQRPAEDPVQGQLCDAETSRTCVRTVLATGTPILWWAGLAAVVGCLILFASKRDWRAGLLGALFLTTLLPWLANTQRVMFEFYALPLVPIDALAIALVASSLVGDATASRNRRLVVGGLTATLIIAVAVEFWWLMPVLTGDVIPYSSWNARVIGTWGFSGWVDN